MQFTVIFENSLQAPASSMAEARRVRDEWEAAGFVSIGIRQNWS